VLDGSGKIWDGGVCEFIPAQACIQKVSALVHGNYILLITTAVETVYKFVPYSVSGSLNTKTEQRAVGTAYNTVMNDNYLLTGRVECEK
jgi:hypothetical protein